MAVLENEIRDYSCARCLNLKIRNMNYSELTGTWNELYYPTNITEGYATRMCKESIKLGIPFKELKMRFVYCAKGILNRFYIIRSTKQIKVKVRIGHCESYR
jgi:hypothetical protein